MRVHKKKMVIYGTGTVKTNTNNKNKRRANNFKKILAIFCRHFQCLSGNVVNVNGKIL